MNTHPPRSLRLEFSKAADHNRVMAVFYPSVLSQIDPDGYVVRRLNKDIKIAIDDGACGFLSDEVGAVRGLLFAYRYPANKNGRPVPNTHDYTEFGTALSLMPGYGSARLIMAALALKEWWDAPPDKLTVNEIEHDNAASVKTYRDSLKWEEIADPEQIKTLFEVCYRNVDADMGNGPGKPPPPAKQKKKAFYAFTDAALAVHARILLDFMKRGGLENKRTGDFIPVDFTALEKAGLTQRRIEAMAMGITSRQVLSRITGPSSSSPPPAP